MEWIERVRDGLDAADAQYPFLLYGTDWLAFAHLVIAVAFYGPYRDPVRNIWVIEFGMIACAGIIPLALICGPIRGIPFWWTVIDMSFGVFGVIPLYVVRAGSSGWRRSRAGGTAKNCYPGGLHTVSVGIPCFPTYRSEPYGQCDRCEQREQREQREQCDLRLGGSPRHRDG